AVARILELEDVLGVVWLEEARPSGARFELRVRREQRQSAQPAHVRALVLVVQEKPAERALGSLMQDHVALLRRKPGGDRFDPLRRERSDVVAGTRCGHDPIVTPKRAIGYYGGDTTTGVGCVAPTPMPTPPSTLKPQHSARPLWVRPHVNA